MSEFRNVLAGCGGSPSLASCWRSHTPTADITLHAHPDALDDLEDGCEKNKQIVDVHVPASLSSSSSSEEQLIILLAVLLAC